MKKTKTLLLLLPLMMVLSSCSGTTPHEHTFSSEWEKNEMAHWHKATCEHSNLMKDYGTHVDTNKDGKCDVCLFEIVVPPTPHEHTFSDTYSFNESCHWHEATCEHTELVSNLEEHIFVDGVCKCGYVEPKPEPIPEETFYLPKQEIDYFNGVMQNFIEYIYDEDLLGFQELTHLYDENGESFGTIKRVHRYNEDFSIETYDVYNCSIDETTKETVEILTDHTVFHNYENNSYSEERYIVDVVEQTMEYYGDIGHFYNEAGKETLYYQLHPIADSTDKEIFIYNETIYDENNRPIRDNSYEGTLENKVLDSYTIYTYDDVEPFGLATEYIFDVSKEDFVIDCYRHLMFEEDKGISYVYEQIEYPDGSIGNLNKFGYDAQGKKVLLNYNNSIVKEIKENENFQITEYNSLDYNGDTVKMNVSYNEQSLISVTTKYDHLTSSADVESITTYLYSETKQMVEAISSYARVGDEPEVQNLVSKISYTDIESKELLSRVGISESMYRMYSDEVLVYGLY